MPSEYSFTIKESGSDRIEEYEGLPPSISDEEADDHVWLAHEVAADHNQHSERELAWPLQIGILKDGQLVEELMVSMEMEPRFYVFEMPSAEPGA